LNDVLETWSWHLESQIGFHAQFERFKKVDDGAEEEPLGDGIDGDSSQVRRLGEHTAIFSKKKSLRVFINGTNMKCIYNLQLFDMCVNVMLV
jgi:hypothetical protein